MYVAQGSKEKVSGLIRTGRERWGNTKILSVDHTHIPTNGVRSSRFVYDVIGYFESGPKVVSCVCTDGVGYKEVESALEVVLEVFGDVRLIFTDIGCSCGGRFV